MPAAIPSPEHDLYDAAARWSDSPGSPTEALIRAAARARAAGLESPSLDGLAAASPGDREDELHALLDAALDELGLPRPDSAAPGGRVVHGGEVFARLPRESVRFAIVPATPAGFESASGSEGIDHVEGHQVQVFVDDVEVTSRGAGLGMAPFHFLVPGHELTATDVPRIVPIARCECGDYGCGMTDARILHDGDAVHWDWLHEAPMPHGVTFEAGQYAAALADLHADHGWEGRHDTTARLLMEGADHARLAELGLRLTGAWLDFPDPSRFVAALMTTDDRFQVLVRTPATGRLPQAVAADLLTALEQPPATWSATFNVIDPELVATPPMAGPDWQRGVPY